MKPFIFLLAFMWMLPSVSAIDCDSFVYEELCDEIINSDLSWEEKQYLLEDLLDELKNFPSHDYVRNWNINIDINDSPYGTQKHDNGLIEDAWVKLVTVMPTVLEEGKLYHGGSGEILSAFNHEVNMPSGRMPGDCKTKYYLKENKGKLKAYVNGHYEGSGKLVSYSAHKDIQFKVKYEVKVKIKIKHYKKEDGKCKYDDYEYETDYLTLHDSFNAKYYDLDTETEFVVKDVYGSTTKGILSGKEFTSMHLEFPTSYLKQFDYVYSIEWGTPPYNVLTVKAEKKSHLEHDNLLYEGTNPYTVFVENIDNCKTTAYNHFGSITKDCNLAFESLNITINTDKLVYDSNETIQVSIEPSDKTFNLHYAEENVSVSGNVDLVAVHPYNKIAISHEGRTYEKIIHVKNNTSWNLLFSLMIFFGINKAFVEYVRRKWGL